MYKAYTSQCCSSIRSTCTLFKNSKPCENMQLDPSTITNCLTPSSWEKTRNLTLNSTAHCKICASAISSVHTFRTRSDSIFYKPKMTMELWRKVCFDWMPPLTGCHLLMLLPELLQSFPLARRKKMKFLLGFMMSFVMCVFILYNISHNVTFIKNSSRSLVWKDIICRHIFKSIFRIHSLV